MKQLMMVGLMTLVGVIGPFVYSPFCGVAVYYLFAILRPQYIWEWSLPPDIPWSRFVSLATFGAFAAVKLGFIPTAGDPMRRDWRISRTDAILFLFFCWINVTYFMAHDRELSAYCYQEYLKIFALYALSSLILGTISQLWILLIIAGVSLGYIAYEVNFLYLQSGYLGIAKNGYGGLDNNGAGLMLAMGVPICLAIWDGIESRIRWFFLGLIPIIVHAVLMTYSRGEMISLIVVSPLLLIRARCKRKLAPFALILAVLVAFMAGPQIRERFFTLKASDADESANSRRASWAAGLAIARDYPIFGVGIRNSGLFVYRYGADMEGRTIHSQYIQIAADCGFPGMILYIGLVASVWLDTRRVRRAISDRSDAQSRRAASIASGVENALATFCFGGLFLSLENFELPYLLILLGSRASSLVTTIPGAVSARRTVGIRPVTSPRTVRDRPERSR